MIGEFCAAFDAIDGGVRFTAKVGVAGNIDADIGAARQIRKAEMQAAAGELEAEFVKGGVADDGVVLRDHGKITGLVHACGAICRTPDFANLFVTFHLVQFWSLVLGRRLGLSEERDLNRRVSAVLVLPAQPLTAEHAGTEVRTSRAELTGQVGEPSCRVKRDLVHRHAG